MKTYDKFLEYYDQIVRGINSPLEDEVEFLLKDAIDEHNPGSKSILEVACGTWTVAAEIQKKGYNVTWLDISQNMLDKAKNNMKKWSELILADMTDFDLWKKYDVILCNYNSICHLLKWEDWQKFFTMASNHLEKDGLLVFDIVTLFEFENITKEFAQFYTFWENNVCMEMFKKPGMFEWLVKMYEKADDGRFDLTTENVQENSFPISKIEKELKTQWFKVAEKTDFHYGEVTAQSERVYFMCKKK